MILTDDFVFIHLPKTGGTFVGDAIRRLYPGGIRRVRSRLSGPRPVGRPAVDHGHLHAPRHEVPESHRSHPVLATVRNPYEHYVSVYEFGEWRKAEANPDFAGYDWPRIRSDHPEFPDLTFERYLEIFGRVGYRCERADRPDLGWFTVRFAWQFVIDRPPDATSPLDAIVEATVGRTDDVVFVHTEDLNSELHAALLEFGLPKEAVAFIPSAPKVLPTKGGRTDDQEWSRYYDDGLRSLVRGIDAPVFERFPEYDIRI